MTDFVYTIKAHPTTYAGVNFRSRLEATWAAFFDLCGWGWEYEPFDLEGWTPDFLLKGASPCLVEVKPIDFSTDGPYFERSVSLARRYAAKVQDNIEKLPVDPVSNFRTTPYEYLVLGLGPFYAYDYMERIGLGVFLLDSWNMGGDIALMTKGERPHMFDFCAESGWFGYRISGEYDGDHHLEFWSSWYIHHLWKSAKNKVQWKPAQ